MTETETIRIRLIDGSEFRATDFRWMTSTHGGETLRATGVVDHSPGPQMLPIGTPMSMAVEDPITVSIPERSIIWIQEKADA
jgi:hypothetical protein